MNILIFFVIFLAFTRGQVLSNLSSKIVNGEDAKLGEIPYQVSLQNSNHHFCGGSIVNKYWVVSAAHCVLGLNAENIQILVGSIDLEKPFKYHQVTSIVIHENYTGYNSGKDDISLLKVKEPFEFSLYVKSVPIPKPHSTVEANSSAIVSGWGFKLNWVPSYILQKVQIYITDQKRCVDIMNLHGYNVHPTQICANDPNETKGECNGDSGGPLTVDGVLVGIVSWSVKEPTCGSPYYPAVYTRVSEYVEWILQHTSEN